MPPDEHVLRVVGEWLEKADNDLTNATFTLGLGDACPTDTVCFHAQQCIEKCLKALLTLRGADVPKAHALDTLLERLPSELRPTMTADEQDRLTEYATVTRYPGDYDPIPLDEARKAVDIARRVREDVAVALRRRP